MVFVVDGVGKGEGGIERPRETSDNSSALTAAAFLGGVLFLVPNTLPLVLGIVANRFNATAVELGLINSLYNGACFVATASAPAWLPRVRQRPVALIAALVLILVLGSTASLRSIDMVLWGFLIVGVAAGAAAAPGNAALGQSSFPARWFGISAIMQLGLAAIFALLLHPIERLFGPAVGFAALGLLLLPSLPAALMLRSRPGRASQPHETSAFPTIVRFRDGAPMQRWALVAAFAALVLYVLAAISYWIFIEPMGRAAGLGETTIALGVTAGIVSAGVGALIFTLLARRILLAPLIGISLAVTAYSLMFVPRGPNLVASLVLFNLAFGILTPALTSVIRRADFTGRLFVSSGSAILIGNTIGGPPAGMLVAAFGFGGLLVAAILVTLAVILPLVFSLYFSKPTSADAAPATFFH